MKRQIRFIFLIAVVLTTLLFVVACGDDAPEPTATPIPPTLTSAPPTATTTKLADTATSEATQAPASQIQSPLSVPESPLAAPVQSDYVPGAGKAGLRGRILFLKSGKPIPDSVVRLAELFCPDDVKAEEKQEKCVFMLDGAFSPSTFSDKDGYFEFKNVEVRDYSLLVGDSQGNNAIAKDENGIGKFWTTKDGEVLDVGEQMLDYELLGN